MKNRLVILCAAFALLSLCPLRAQDRDRYSSLNARNLFLTTSNPAAVAMDSLGASKAVAGATVEGGNYRKGDDAPILWRAGAEAASVKHILKKGVSFKGGFSFYQTQMYNTAGSMLINPGYYPVDIMEFTPGTKILQRYALDGSIGYRIGRNLRIGGGLDFNAANYSKRKDLRYSSFILDMSVKLSAIYSLGAWDLGATYIYQRKSEAPKAEQIGNSTTSYYAFLNKGNDRGVFQLWNNAGTHLDESGVSGFPIFENFHGFALQAAYAKSTMVEFKVLFTKGGVGERGYDWFRWNGGTYTLAASHRFRAAGGMWLATLVGMVTTRKTSESIFDKTTTGGVTTPTIYGWNAIGESVTARISPIIRYKARNWNAFASLAWMMMSSLDYQMYPFWDVITRQIFSFDFGGAYNFRGWEFNLKGGLAKGAVTLSDGRVSDIVTTSEPYFHKRVSTGKNDYTKAFTLTICPAVNYHFNNGIFVGVLFRETGAIGNFTVTPGHFRGVATIHVGINF